MFQLNCLMLQVCSGKGRQVGLRQISVRQMNRFCFFILCHAHFPGTDLLKTIPIAGLTLYLDSAGVSLS